MYGHFTYEMTALLSEMSIFWNKTACEITLTLKLQVVYGHSTNQVTVLLSETFIVWFIVP